MYFAVCNAGYYLNSTTCEMCKGNTIKRTPGNDINCNRDAPCDGVTVFPDDQHTECGESA